jgi:hypothetical protein
MNASINDRKKMCQETLAKFSAAWGAGDVDTLLSLMSDEPIYKGSTGPGPGTVNVGIDEVGIYLERMVGGNSAPDPSANPVPPPPMYFIDDDRALVFWSLKLPNAEGVSVDVDGVDILTFTDDGRIATKDAYRKAFS